MSLSPLRPTSAFSPLRHSSSTQASAFSSTANNLVWVQKRIQVKLRSDHPELGKAGQVIRVKPGHMRQRLYPSGQALYCARDGVPFHHLPPISPASRVLPPGLSRPIVELTKRLGVKIKLSTSQLKLTEQLREQVIRDASRPSSALQLPAAISKTTTTTHTIVATPRKLSPAPTGQVHIPDGLREELRNLTREKNPQLPVLKFERPGPADSETLYASVKLDEVLDQLISLLNPRFDSTVSRDVIKILGSYPSGTPATERTLKFRPIKISGSHVVCLAVLGDRNVSEEALEKFEFLVQVDKI